MLLGGSCLLGQAFDHILLNTGLSLLQECLDTKRVDLSEYFVDRVVQMDPFLFNMYLNFGRLLVTEVVELLSYHGLLRLVWLWGLIVFSRLSF